MAIFEKLWKYCLIAGGKVQQVQKNCLKKLKKKAANFGKKSFYFFTFFVQIVNKNYSAIFLWNSFCEKKGLKEQFGFFPPNFHLLKKKYRSVNENYLANCRIKLQKLHRFTEAGLDEDSLQEMIEGLHSLSDCYQANSDAI